MSRIDLDPWHADPLPDGDARPGPRTFTLSGPCEGGWPTLDEVKRAYWESSRRAANGMPSQAAKLMGVALKTVYNWINQDLSRGSEPGSDHG